MEAGPSNSNKVLDTDYVGLSLATPQMPVSSRRSARIRSKGAVDLEASVLAGASSLAESSRVYGKILDFQRLEVEGGILPPIERFELSQAARREEKQERKRAIRTERVEARKRRRIGGEVGDAEAVQSVKRASAGLLAHAGFDGEW